MSAHVVFGTAGHVDHGKTALVRALTGVDTDRLEEEKRRGITIDLGFAELELGEGLTASIVDVPGHEDFVRNMVAGATGIDAALLVVAADEGVMPQTDEHLAILDFLHVRAGVVAISKVDLVEPEWLELVEADIRSRMKRSRVTWNAVIPVSAVTGTGLDELKAALAETARLAMPRDGRDLFRLPVDRVFTVSGTGTVVTGTTWSGSVQVGDEVTIFPGAQRTRIRGVQVHGRSHRRVEPGRRTALALSGVERSAVARGSWIVGADGWRAVERLDVAVTLLSGAPPLTQRTRVRLHLGTAEVLARVTPAGSRIGPGESGYVRLRLETPVLARWGDAAVLRSYSPVATIGGVVVLDPWPPPRPRRPVGLDRLTGDGAARVAALVQRSGTRGVPVAELPIRLGIRPYEIEATVGQAARHGVVSVDGWLLDRAVVDGAQDALLATLTAFHRDEPLAAGMSRQEWRRAVRSEQLAPHAERQLVAQGAVVVDGPLARLASHRAELAVTQHEVAERLGNVLRDAGFEGCTAAELADRCNTDVDQASRIAEFFVRQGTAGRIGSERYFDKEVLDRMVEVATAEIARLGEASPGQLRAKLGLTRKYLIPFLEWLDAQGYSERAGDVRRPGPRLTRGSDTI